jgi:aspartate/glutamate racemase
MTPTIGIIGGMGNEAMADLAGNIDNITGSEEHRYVLYGNSRQAFTPVEADGEWEKGDEPLLRKRHTGEFTAALLQKLGAVRAGLACNGAHPLFRDIYDGLDTDFVDMIAETAVTTDDDAGVLVLGTKRTLKKRLYDDDLEAAGIDTFQPPPENRGKLMDVIYDPEFGIKTGEITQQAESLLCELIREECGRNPAIDTVVLGCTELPLAINEDSIPRLTDAGALPDHLRFIDPTRVLADALLAGEIDETPPEPISIDSYRGEYLDYHPPFTCAVDSLDNMEVFQSRLIEWTMEYFQSRDAHVGGSYMHMPTLFFVNYDDGPAVKLDGLDITLHRYESIPDEPDEQIEAALRRNFEAVADII